tara:strand:+ start:14646 stop:16301 length:1656 start_codon:yes stop_codon:yes gene_type:complete
MSFEIARMIVQSYRQNNEQRIKTSIETAYQEALRNFQSEQEARQVALEVLQMEQKSFDSFVKDLSKLRRDLIKGESVSAKKAAAARLRNARRKAAVDRANLLGRQQQSYLDKMDKYTSDFNRAQVGQVGANIDLAAQDFANARAKANDMYTTGLSSAVNQLATAVKSGDRTAMENLLTDRIFKEVSKGLQEGTKTQAGYTGTPDQLFPFRRADVGYQILRDIKLLTGFDDSNTEVQRVKDFLFGGYETILDDSKKKVGILGDVASISESEVDARYEQERQKYVENKGRGFAPSMLGDRPRRPRYIDKVFIPEEVPEAVDRTIYQDLRKEAAPVFDALRDDFQIDAQEQEQLSEQSLKAYEQLQEIANTDPLAVTQEEQLLLDDIALKRQMNLLQQRGQLAGMRPQLRSIEAIQSRAADIAEPAKAQKFDPSQFSPAQQKYFATERKAYDLSEKNDNDIRTMGAPEKYGLLLFNKTFDKTKKSYVDGESYNSVLSTLEDAFKGKQEEEFRALASYISRAMALQRSSNPLIFSDGQKNPDYLEALKAINPKAK